MSATQAEKDDAYRAVGRWFVEFSRLLFHMRLCMEDRLGQSDDPMLAKLALGEMTADPLANAFFGMCLHAVDLDDQEEKVAVRLRKEVRDEIGRRNDFAHGDWWIGFGVKEDGAGGDPALMRTKPSRKKDPWVTREVPITEIDERAEALHDLRQMVAEFGGICLNPDRATFIWGRAIRVRDVFRWDKQTSRVFRDGPLAGERKTEYS